MKVFFVFCLLIMGCDYTSLRPVAGYSFSYKENNTQTYGVWCDYSLNNCYQEANYLCSLQNMRWRKHTDPNDETPNMYSNKEYLIKRYSMLIDCYK